MTRGERIKKLRMDAGLSQSELASHVHASRSSISMYECDERWPDFETLDHLADFFDASFDYLLCKTDINTGYPRHNIEITKDATGLRRFLAYAKLIDAYADASADTRAAVRAILHLPEDNDGDR